MKIALSFFINILGLKLLTSCSTPVPEHLTKLKNLHEMSIPNERYEFKKLITLWEGEYKAAGVNSIDRVFFDKKTKSLFFKIKVGELGRNYKLLRINKNGHKIESIDISGYKLLQSGDHFKNDHYIDWVNTGEKTKKKYLKIINANNLDLEQLKKMIQPFSKTYANIDYKNKEGQLYCKSKSGWTLIKSKWLYENFDISRTMGVAVSFLGQVKGLTKIYPERFILLDRFKELPVELEHFEEVERYSTPWLNLGKNSRQDGYYGMGYFKFKFLEDEFKFKMKAFRADSWGINKDLFYYTPNITDPNYLIIYSRKIMYSKKDHQDTGLFILRLKQPKG